MQSVDALHAGYALIPAFVGVAILLASTHHFRPWQQRIPQIEWLRDLGVIILVLSVVLFLSVAIILPLTSD